MSLFKHAPLHEMWDSTFEGMKVEVKNTDCENTSEKLGDYFWVATVLKVSTVLLPSVYSENLRVKYWYTKCDL